MVSSPPPASAATTIAIKRSSTPSSATAAARPIVLAIRCGYASSRRCRRREPCALKCCRPAVGLPPPRAAAGAGAPLPPSRARRGAEAPQAGWRRQRLDAGRPPDQRCGAEGLTHMTTDEAARSTSGATARARALRPRDAATLIIVDTSSGEARVLLGRRRPDMVFMPGRYVFPGGRVDRADRQIAVEPEIASSDLKDLDRKKLMIAMKGTVSEARARALALAPVRHKAPGWQAFYAAGFAPALAELSFFARAITPPGRPRRYDTRFFCAPAEAIVHRVAVADGELSDLEWLSIAQARTLELTNITRVVLEDLGERVAAGGLTAKDFPVPFYHRRNGSYRRDLITAEAALD